MIEFEPDAIGILEQDRVVSRRPLILAWSTNDFRAERDEEAVQFVDVGALAGTETKVMQADALRATAGNRPSCLSRVPRYRCRPSCFGAARPFTRLP
jgi:hypothetical protein